MSFYECMRCGHKVKQKIEIKRHLQRKNKCKRNIQSYIYNDDEILRLSIVKKNSEGESIIDDMSSVLSDENVSQENTVNTNQKNNNFICCICNRLFTRKYNLTRHQKNCSPTKINHHHQTFNNNTNNYNTINNNYNKNLFVNFNIEPFDKEWDVSKITKFTKHSILLSKIMYSNLLNAILENEKNLNVLIEKDTNTGLVYKNNVEKFITMNLKDIIEQSMDKLNKHLNDFYEESLKDDNAIKAYYRWKFQNKYGGGYRTGEIDEEIKSFRVNMKKAYTSLRAGEPTTEIDKHLFKALDLSGKDVSSGRMSILGKRLLIQSKIAPGKDPEVFEARKEILRKRIGEKAYERLVRHDERLEDYAEFWKN